MCRGGSRLLPPCMLGKAAASMQAAAAGVLKTAKGVGIFFFFAPACLALDGIVCLQTSAERAAAVYGGDEIFPNSALPPPTPPIRTTGT